MCVYFFIVSDKVRGQKHVLFIQTSVGKIEFLRLENIYSVRIVMLHSLARGKKVVRICMFSNKTRTDIYT